VGRALLDKLIACARTLNGLEQIVLSVTQYQAAAKKLYESVGFSTWGHEPNSLHVAGESLDEDYMVLRLK
jgi:L-amino acid N-acyltransferase YncA